MLIKLRSHLSFANVVATIALFVALGGTSYAVTKIGPKNIKKNAVRSKHIAKNSIRSKHIKRSQVTSGDIRNGTIQPIDIAPTVATKALDSSAGQARRDAGPTGVAASTSYTPVATLGGLQAGAYVLLAKTNQSADTFTEGRCRLSAEGDSDDSNRGLRPQGTPEAHALQLVHSYARGGSAVLACRTPKGKWSASDSKIIAIRVASASSNVVGG